MNAGNIGACTNTNENEAWVAGNFWDFYDSLAGGKDTIFYVHTGATPKLFLNHGTRDSMSEYLGLGSRLMPPPQLIHEARETVEKVQETRREQDRVLDTLH